MEKRERIIIGSIVTIAVIVIGLLVIGVIEEIHEKMKKELSKEDALLNGCIQTSNWTMRELIKDWLVTPMDLVVTDEEIYVSGNLDNRIVALDRNGQILRYYTVEKSLGFDNVCVGITSQGRVIAASSKGLWELKPDGETEKIVSYSLDINHMIIGLDDEIYVSQRAGEESKISKIGLDGRVTDIVKIDSNRVSDLDFDSQGNLFMADSEKGRIFKYSQEQKLEIIATDIPTDGPHYLAIDKENRIYTISGQLALISEDGTINDLGFDGTGDMVFQNNSLYVLDIYRTILCKLEMDNTTIINKTILIEGVVPWYIDNKDDVIIGVRQFQSERKFYNYNLSNPIDKEPNQILNILQPKLYTIDDLGNIYVLSNNNVLKKITLNETEEYNVTIFGNFGRYFSSIHYNPSDNKIYCFDADSNSIIRINEEGSEIFHKFSYQLESIFLTITLQGKIYAAVITSSGAKLVNISNPSSEKIVWRLNEKSYYIHLDSDSQGNIYVALGPDFQQVYCIDLSDGKAVSIVPSISSRYDMGFVDPQGFAVTDSGVVVLSAPGLLIEFSQV